MRIGLITTIDTNIGDDFIREGICLVLREVLKGERIEFVPVNKHFPLTVYPDWHPVHLSKTLRCLPFIGASLGSTIKSVASRLGYSAFDSCGLIVQCGAPVLWPNCHKNVWAEPLWRHVVGRLYKKIPVLNLAAGSCYPWEQQPSSITDPDDARYIREIAGYCRLTTTRDELAHKLFATLDAQTSLIPCSAFLAANSVGTDEDGPVLINYMHGSGHYDWMQGIDAKYWEVTVKDLINRLSKRHNLALLCHNEAEYKHATAISPSTPILFPKTVEEYFRVTSSAKAAICNRMHASVGLAGMGIPSIAVGTDTRLLMVAAIGLPAFYIKEVNALMLEESLETLIKNRTSQKERLIALRAKTWEKYIEVISVINFA